MGDVIGVGGLLLLAGGIAVCVLGMRTDVTAETGKAAKPVDAYVRSPTWRSASSAERAVAAPAATFPLLFQRSF